MEGKQKQNGNNAMRDTEESFMLDNLDVVYKTNCPSITENDSSRENSSTVKKFRGENPFMDATAGLESNSKGIPFSETIKSTYTETTEYVTTSSNEYIPLPTTEHTPVITCPFCLCSLSSTDDLISHVQQAHVEQQKLYHCSRCPYSCACEVAFRQHVSATKHGRNLPRLLPNTDRPGLPPLACPFCSYETCLKARLEKHVSLHATKQFQSEECPYATAFQGSLRQHRTRGEPLSCKFPGCSYRAFDAGQMRRHSLRHSQQSLKCHACEFKTPYRSAYKAHIARHTGVGRTKCPHCDYSTANRSNYTSHLRQHTGRGLLHCPLCRYTNHRRDYLLKHMLATHEVSCTARSAATSTMGETTC